MSNNQPKNCQLFASSFVKTVCSFSGFEITGIGGSLIMTFFIFKEPEAERGWIS
jgi:hypothetical protein